MYSQLVLWHLQLSLEASDQLLSELGACSRIQKDPSLLNQLERQ